MIIIKKTVYSLHKNEETTSFSSTTAYKIRIIYAKRGVDASQAREMENGKWDIHDNVDYHNNSMTSSYLST